MKRTLSSNLFVVLVLVLLSLQAVLQPTQAQNQEACYAVADNGGVPGSADTLITLNRVTGETILIDYTGTDDIEAIAFELGGETLFAANGQQLGTLNLTTAAFSPRPHAFGTASGVLGEIELDDVDGLSEDPGTDILYGTHRRNSPQLDLLFQIDKESGAYVPNAFGPGIDYVMIDGLGVLHDIDDIAVDPITGQMYAASNNVGDGGVLITVDKDTGAGAVVGEFGVDDIEGLAYFNDGRLYGSTGKYTSGAPTTDRLYFIDEEMGAATLVAPFSQFTDYEALACLTQPTSITLADATVSNVAPSAGSITLVALATLAALTVVVIRRRGAA